MPIGFLDNLFKQKKVYTGVWFMDKSFNDQELSDIMKEIEALEEDYAVTDGEPDPQLMEEVAESKESVPGPAHVTVSKETPVSTANIVSLESKRAIIQEAPVHSTSSSTSMSFKVQGNLTLDLQFDIGGKIVCLEVTESGLAIEIEGGIKFAVPVVAPTSIKKAV
jgi:hypothetical protein